MTILAGKNDESVVKIISSEDHPICYEEVNGETVNPFKIDADTLEGKSVQDIVKLVPNPDLSGYAKSTEVESLKTSVSEGKKLVAAAVTDKGVNTAADSTFQVIANNINGIHVGLGDLQKTLINAGKTTYEFDVDKNSTGYGMDEAVYMSIKTSDGSIETDRLYGCCEVSSNNATSSLMFYWRDSKDYYRTTQLTISITYSLIDDKFIISARNGTYETQKYSVVISKVNDYIEIKITCAPGKCGYSYHDTGYEADCYWDTACTDRSYKTFVTKLSGYIYCYRDSSNHGGGTIAKVPISDIEIA